MNTKIFSKEEIYDLLNADNSAYSLENSTGYSSTWSEFADESEYTTRLSKLGDAQYEFENKLRETSKIVDSKLKDLEKINIDDFDNNNDFFEARENIQNNIIEDAMIYLGDYIYD